MKGHKGSTIYKSGSYDLGPKHAMRVRNQNKVGSQQGRGHTGVGPGRGWAEVELDQYRDNRLVSTISSNVFYQSSGSISHPAAPKTTKKSEKIDLDIPTTA